MSTHSWIHPSLEIRESKIHGKGVFATTCIKASERLAIFGGDIMLIDEINNLAESMQDYPMQIEERFVLGSREERTSEDTDYFNHSCAPNAGFKGQIFLVAMRDIEKNEEITFDYSMVLSQSVGSDIVFTMECQCGSESCRKMISEEDWKKPELQKKYRGFFSEYISEKIEETNRTDFSKLCEGDKDPTLNKTINTLIEATEDWIVYLDADLSVEWAQNDNIAETESFGAIANMVAYYESLSSELLAKRHIEPFHRLLGESLARSYENHTERANEILTRAKEYMDARSKERAKMWYLCSSASVVTCVSIVILLVKCFYAHFYLWAGPAWTDIIIGSLFGSIGAFISIISRSSEISVNAAAGLKIHIIDGLARVFVAMLGAFLVAVCLKANLVLSMPNGLDSPRLYLIAFCIVAGASERIVPDLIQKVGGTIDAKDKVVRESK
ncbi:MAG: SET domain-containing protein [Acidobacteriota bacterium]